MSSNSDHMPARRYVPNDITILILARLPVKSLLRFSCVSKTWNAWLRTPKFISEHHETYNSNQNNNNSSYLVYMRRQEQENDAQTIRTVLDEKDGLKKSGFVLPFSRYVKSLARLLVKSLLRFSWVSKTWNSLFRTLQFMTKPSNPNNNSSHHQKQENGVRTISTMLGERDGLVKSNFELSFSIYGIVGYCYGLILLQSCGLYYIWNPFVGILKPIQEGGLPETHGYTEIVEGFGFARRSGDYRILKIRFNCTGRWSHVVEMYSLTADRWTIIERGCEERLPFWRDIKYHNVFFKGSIYFVARLREGFEKNTILRFDLDEQVFSELVPPLCSSGNIPWNLTVLGGDTLALLGFDKGGFKMHVLVWLWNEDSTSWTAQTHHFDIPPFLSLVHITKAGQIVMEPMTVPGERRGFFIYGYDANRHEFKLTILETCHISQAMYSHCVIPINKESLFLMDRDVDKEDILLLGHFLGNPSTLNLIRGLIRDYVIHP